MSTPVPVEVEIGKGVPTALYRLYAADDSLLYIGVTGNLEARFTQHAKAKTWWADVTRKTAAWYPSRAEAREAEIEAIEGEQPRHNIAHKVRVPRAPEPLHKPRRHHIPENWGQRFFATLFGALLAAGESDLWQWLEQMELTGAKNLKELGLASGSTPWWEPSEGARAVLDRLWDGVSRREDAA